METSLESFERDWNVCGWVPPGPSPDNSRASLFSPGAVITIRGGQGKEGVYTVDWRTGSERFSNSGTIRAPLTYDSETKMLSVDNSEIDVGGTKLPLKTATAGLVCKDLLALTVHLGDFVEGNVGTIIAEASSGEEERPGHRRSPGCLLWLLRLIGHRP